MGRRGNWFLQVCDKQCDQCLFSPARIVSGSRMKEILDECEEKDEHFLCHKSTVVGGRVVCRGFYDNKTSDAIRLAQNLGLIVFVDVNKSMREGLYRLRNKLKLSNGKGKHYRSSNTTD